MSDTTTPVAPIGFSHLPGVETLSPAQAQHEIAEAMAGRHLRGYFDSGDAGHAAAVERVAALHARLHGGEEPWNDVEADLPAALAPHEIHDKIHNHLSLNGATDADATELREGLAQSAVTLGLDHGELGTVVMRLNDALGVGIGVTAEDAEAHLRASWGDRYDANLAAANLALDRLERTRPGTRDFIARTGLGNDPTTISVLARAGQRLRGGRR